MRSYTVVKASMLYKVCFEHFFEFFRCNGESQSLRFNLSQEILKVGTPRMP
jgi:hypothetical protein